MRRKLVGVPKGRLYPYAMAGFRDQVVCGCDPDMDLLLGEVFDLIRLKSRDLLPLLRQRAVDHVVVPHEWLIEDARTYRDREVVVEHVVPSCIVELAWLTRSKDCCALGDVVSATPFVVTTFPATARHFMQSLGVMVPTIVVSGSVEAIVSVQGALGFDVVETGRTARLHGLTAYSVLRTRGLVVASRRTERLAGEELGVIVVGFRHGGGGAGGRAA